MKISIEQRPEQKDIVIPLYIEIMLFLVPLCCAFLCMFQNCSFTHPVKGFCGGVAQGLNECSGYCVHLHTMWVEADHLLCLKVHAVSRPSTPM